MPRQPTPRAGAGRPLIVLRLFIVGCPRSGTTLLQSLLAAHPALISAPESHAFNLLLERRLYPAAKSVDNYRAFRTHMLDRHPAVDLPDPSLDDEAFAAAFLAGMDALAAGQGKQGWVEKTPDHLHCIDAIRKAAPDARFIHVLREPRSTIASLLVAAWRDPDAWGGDKGLAWAADKWNAAMIASGRWVGQPGHLFVGYEHLCTDPAAVLADICAQLGLEPPPLDRLAANTADELILPGERWKADNRSPVVFRALEKFRALFTPLERLAVSCLIDWQAADVYARHGARAPGRTGAWCGLLPARASRRMSAALTRRARRRLLERDREARPPG